MQTGNGTFEDRAVAFIHVLRELIESPLLPPGIDLLLLRVDRQL